MYLTVTTVAFIRHLLVHAVVIVVAMLAGVVAAVIAALQFICSTGTFYKATIWHGHADRDIG